MGYKFYCVDHWNWYTDEALKDMTDILDSGEVLKVGASCLGHGDSNAMTESVKRKLTEHYGDRLRVVSKEGLYSYSYTYKLN